MSIRKRKKTGLNIFGATWVLYWWCAAIVISWVTYFTAGGVTIMDVGISLLFFTIAIFETKNFLKRVPR